jgi:hypothetical protein
MEKMASKQRLVIEIDCWHDMFHGQHTPAIVDVLHQIADHLESCGVQMASYPFGEKDENGNWVILVNLDESLQDSSDDEYTDYHRFYGAIT